MNHYSEVLSRHERNVKNFELYGNLSEASKEIANMVKDFTQHSLQYVYDNKDITIPEVELGIRHMVDQCINFFYEQGYLRKNRGQNISTVNVDRATKSVTVSIYPRCAKRAFTFSMSIE